MYTAHCRTPLKFTQLPLSLKGVFCREPVSGLVQACGGLGVAVGVVTRRRRTEPPPAAALRPSPAAAAAAALLHPQANAQHVHPGEERPAAAAGGVLVVVLAVVDCGRQPLWILHIAKQVNKGGGRIADRSGYFISEAHLME